MIDDDFYATLKLKSGEEIFCKIAPTEEATDIILYHEMNDNFVTQVIGRANRIGRTESLTVHHLV